MMPVHVEVQYFLFYQTLLLIADCWPIRIAIIIIISVQILCGYNYVCFTVIIIIIDTRKYITF